MGGSFAVGGVVSIKPPPGGKKSNLPGHSGLGKKNREGKERHFGDVRTVSV
jgi:hypothetical protein